MTHPICEDCYRAKYRRRALKGRRYDEMLETCCFCGGTTVAGLYESNCDGTYHDSGP